MKNSTLKRLDFIILDIMSLIVAFFCSYNIKGISNSLLTNKNYIEILIVLIIIDSFTIFFFQPFKGVLKRGYLIELEKTLILCFINLSETTLLLFAIKESSTYSRLMFAYTFILYFVFSYITRTINKVLLRKKQIRALNKGSKSLLIVCKNAQIKDIVEDIENNNHEFYYISGICIVDKDLIGKTYKEYKIVANLNNVLNYISTSWIDDIYVCCKYNDLTQDVIDGFVSTGINLHLLFSKEGFFTNRNQYVSKIGSYKVISSTRRENPNWELFLKLIMDIGGGIIGSLITLILICVIGPIIYIKSPGPIIYVSKRVGKNGKIFNFYKFRSMVLNADALKQDLAKQNRVKDGMMFKIENDPRIIPGIGNFIRKTSLDEFPQFFNVLKGDMSLVGTRPPTMDEWSKYTPYYRSRMLGKPGITGMWQVSGRSEITDFNEVVKLDNEYIDNWNIGLDIKILFKTVGKLFKHDSGAM